MARNGGCPVPPGSLKPVCPPHMPQNSKDLLAEVKKITNRVLLAFSCGKDSLACLIALQEAGFDVLPYWCWTFPDTRFEWEVKEYYEQFFGIKIVATASPSFWMWLNSGTAMGPVDSLAIAKLGMVEYDYHDIRYWLADDYGIPRDKAWNAVGIRWPDSTIRQAAIRKHGPMNLTKLNFWPVFDFSKDDIITILKWRNCPLPPWYKVFGRSYGGGFEYRFLEPIRQHYPDDWRRIKFWFPLAWVELARKQISDKHGYSRK